MEVPAFVRGAIAPTFTVFTQDGAIDECGQRNFLDFLLQSGAITTYFVRSGMGLMYTYSMDDTRQMARIACGHLKGKAAVLVGASGIWDRNPDKLPDQDTYIREGIELGNYALEQGADGVVYTVPEGLKPLDGETIEDLLKRYFSTICAAVPGPVFIYQPPGTRKDYELSPEMLGWMADIDNLLGAKVSTADAFYVYELLRGVRGKKFGFIAGNETAFYAALSAGARACIGQGTTVNPQMFRHMVDACDRGDWQGVMDGQDGVNTLLKHSPNPVDFMKMYATEQGFDTPLFDRSQKSNPYMSDRVQITREEYDRFKPIFEREIAKFS